MATVDVVVVSTAKDGVVHRLHRQKRSCSGATVDPDSLPLLAEDLSHLLLRQH